MPKLYQILLRKIGLWSPPVPESEDTKVFNPVKGAKIGGSMTLNVLDYRGLNFFIQEIKEYQVVNHNMKFTDLVLTARPFNKPDVTVRLRLVPNPQGDITHRVLLLKLYDSLAYNEGLHGAVKSETKNFIVDDDKMDADPTNDTREEYFRVGGVGVSYKAKVKTLTDHNSDGRVDVDEVNTETIEFWDYSREAVVDNVKEEQYLFVEMNLSGRDEGWFTLWQGTEINPERVDAI